jgi:uncharacterized protein YcfJ
MSNREGFGDGFWLGAIVGSVVGGIVGASIATQRANRLAEGAQSGRFSGENNEKRPFKSSRRRSIDRMEIARESLDRKINDLNNAIDSVRSSIGNVTEEPIDRLDVDIKTQSPIDPQK